MRNFRACPKPLERGFETFLFDQIEDKKIWFDRLTHTAEDALENGRW
ncbi:hypothetical protein [Bartonella apis]